LAELTFPASEGITGGLLSTSLCVVCSIWLLAADGHLFVLNGGMVFESLLATILAILARGKNKRLECEIAGEILQ